MPTPSSATTLAALIQAQAAAVDLAQRRTGLERRCRRAIERTAPRCSNSNTRSFRTACMSIGEPPGRRRARRDARRRRHHRPAAARRTRRAAGADHETARAPACARRRLSPAGARRRSAAHDRRAADRPQSARLRSVPDAERLRGEGRRAPGRHGCSRGTPPKGGDCPRPSRWCCGAPTT